jgi:membrane dipeptidase
MGPQEAGRFCLIEALTHTYRQGRYWELTQDLEVSASPLHFDSIVVDGHCDTILHCMKMGRTLRERSGDGHLDLPRMREGGVDCQFFACYIGAEYKPERGLKRALQMIDRFYTEIRAAGDTVVQARNHAEIMAAVESGKIAAVLTMEGGECLDTDVSNVRIMKELGVVAIGLTWNERNMIADGVGEERTGGGLTNFGVEVVREMNRTGIIVDVSHLSEAGFWDVLEVSQKPVIASHSNAKAVCNHRRNLTDEQLVALAKNGGATGMNFAKDFVAPKDADLAGVIRHIEHICALIGPDHIGLGSDFDGIGEGPKGLEDVTKMPAITRELIHLGYSEGNIRKILGGNFLRVIKEVVC